MGKKVQNLLNIKFDSELVYGDNDKYINTKIKIYVNDVNTSFQGKKVQKENAPNKKCLILIILDSAVEVQKKYYPQTFLEECNYKTKKTKMENLINDKLEGSSSDYETENVSDNDSNDETESDNEKDNDGSSE